MKRLSQNSYKDDQHKNLLLVSYDGEYIILNSFFKNNTILIKLTQYFD